MVLSDDACFEYSTDGFVGYIPVKRRLLVKYAHANIGATSVF